MDCSGILKSKIKIERGCIKTRPPGFGRGRYPRFIRPLLRLMEDFMDNDTLQFILAEIDRFRGVANNLSEEGMKGGEIVQVLINHLKIKFRDRIKGNKFEG